MRIYTKYLYLVFRLSILLFFTSCQNKFSSNNYVAYFGGEIINPKNSYVLFCRNNEVLDTLKLDKNNRFFKKFDSLTPGMYSFKHEPEYQYVYFDKNDSIMLRVNSNEFDNSLIFCGKGDEKNNFLTSLYLKNEEDKNKMFAVFDFPFPKFSKYIDSCYQTTKKYYEAKKQEIKWGSDFDKYAKSSLDFHYYSKKEIYPIIHKTRTGTDVFAQLPKNYYNYRKNIDYNNIKLSNYSPFVNYLSHLLNNLGTIKYHNHFSDVDLSLKTSINKLNIADTLIKNNKVKNTILNNIAFSYLLEDQNMISNLKFFETYHKYSTDNSQKNEINKIANSIQLLKKGNKLPSIELLNTQNKIINSNAFANKKTIIFFWTKDAVSHLEAVHKKVLELQTKHPDYNFVGINLKDSEYEWKSVLNTYKFDNIIEYRCPNFDEIKFKWVITKIHRVILLDKGGKIDNAFANLFEQNFEDNLK